MTLFSFLRCPFSLFPVVPWGRVAMTAVWTPLSPKYSREVTDRVAIFPVAFGTHIRFCIESCCGWPCLKFCFVLAVQFVWLCFNLSFVLCFACRGGSLSSLRIHLASGSGYLSCVSSFSLLRDIFRSVRLFAFVFVFFSIYFLAFLCLSFFSL